MKPRLLCLMLPALIAAGCATGPEPRWTPETAAPPASPPPGVEQAAPLDTRAAPLPPNLPNPAPLTRDGAILTALTNNRGIEVAAFGPRIGETLVPEARAAFDPVLLGAVSAGRDTRPLEEYSPSAPAFPTAAYTTVGSVASQAQRLVEQSKKLGTTLDAIQTPSLVTDDTRGSLTLRQALPTGTEFFLTGSLSDTHTNLSEAERQGAWSLGVSQPLLEGAGARVNLALLRQAANRSAQSGHAFRAAVLELVRQVETAYWGLVLAEELVKIREFAVELADRQLRRNEDLLSVGRAIEGDVMAARAEKATRTADLTDARAAVRSQNIALVRLLNPDAADPWAVTFSPQDPPETAPLAVDGDKSGELALQYRPEVAQARLAEANTTLDVIRTRNSLLPSLDLTGAYGVTSRGGTKGAMTGGLDDLAYDNYRVGLEFQAPVLNRAEKARHRRAVLLESQAERNVAAVGQLVEAEARQAAVELEKQWQRIEAARQAVASRTEQLRVAEGRNESGRTTDLDLMIVQRDFIQSQVDEVTARVRHIQAATLLHAAEGTLLERRGVTLETADNPE